MKILEIELPSNRKFGFFFTLVFAVFAVFFFYFANMILAYAFLATSSILLFITLIKADFLLPLNKIWMQFGLLIGMIVSPIVLGIIFFGLVTPYGVSMKMFGRDELKLKFTNRLSYWITRIEPIKSESFKRQF
jgi:hypothetical protein